MRMCGPPQAEDSRARHFRFRKQRTEMSWVTLHAADADRLVAALDVAALEVSGAGRGSSFQNPKQANRVNPNRGLGKRYGAGWGAMRVCPCGVECSWTSWLWVAVHVLCGEAAQLLRRPCFSPPGHRYAHPYACCLLRYSSLYHLCNPLSVTPPSGAASQPDLRVHHQRGRRAAHAAPLRADHTAGAGAGAVRAGLRAPVRELASRKRRRRGASRIRCGPAGSHA